MKKILSILLVMTIMFTLAGCGDKPAEDKEPSKEVVNESVEDGEKKPAKEEDKEDKKDEDEKKEPAKKPVDVAKHSSAADFYGKVWAKLSKSQDFPAAGGDSSHQTEGPGKFAITSGNKESFVSLLHVTDKLYGMLDSDGATLQHMMNTNSFTSAAVKLKDSSRASEFAEGYKKAIHQQRWMCGFPDKVVVISSGDYIVMGYGTSGIVNSLIKSCSAVESNTRVLVNTAAVVE